MTLRNALFKCLRYSGLPWLLRHTVQQRRVTLVMFHDIAPDYAERAFAFLKRAYNVIALDDYLEARRKGDSRALPPRALVITLDDGHARNRELLPILEKLNLPVTIFLCAGIVGTRRHFWFKYRHPDVNIGHLKTVSNAERLAALARAGFDPLREWEQPQALDRQDIEQMRSRVNFQSHTSLHPCLPHCTDEEAWAEIAGSRQTLEQDYGLRVNALAFPNGDYNARDLALVRRAGYACAITVDFGCNTLHTDPYRLRRLSIDDTDNEDAVCVKASGLWTFLLALLGQRRWKSPYYRPGTIVAGEDTHNSDTSFTPVSGALRRL
ncbi:MAG: polysaccharide deacetylase family protein [Saprospiraceae bacterium]|nr:polysaccharide deacetylase family protein [Saprospiraceae bacterium]MDW8230033.1 polysaccharide deacetylase family protein [Saprospiraceae bacterium]